MVQQSLTQQVPLKRPRASAARVSKTAVRDKQLGRCGSSQLLATTMTTRCVDHCQSYKVVSNIPVSLPGSGKVWGDRS